MPEYLLTKHTALRKPVIFLVGILTFIGGLSLFALMAITIIAVVWRYQLDNPIFGIEDLSTMTLTVVVGSAIACAALKRNHVGINVISWFAGRPITRVTDLIARIISLIIVLLACLSLFDKAGCGIRCGLITSNLSIEQSLFYYFLCIAFLVFGAVLLTEILTGIKNWNGDDPNEPSE